MITLKLSSAASISERREKEFTKAFIQHFWTLWSVSLLSKLYNATPEDSGALKRALYAEVRGDRFVVSFQRGAFYWRFLPEMRAEYQRIYDREVPRMIEVAYQQAAKDAGIKLS